MPVFEQIGIMAIQATEALAVDMFIVLARRITVVLGCSIRMARRTLSIDIDRSTFPVRCGLATVAADGRAGTVTVGDG